MAIHPLYLALVLLLLVAGAACADEDPVAGTEDARYLDLRREDPTGADPRYLVFAASDAADGRLAFLAWGGPTEEGFSATTLWWAGERVGAESHAADSPDACPWVRGALMRVPGGEARPDEIWREGTLTHRLVIRVDYSALEPLGPLLNRWAAIQGGRSDAPQKAAVALRAVARRFGVEPAASDVPIGPDPVAYVVRMVETCEAVPWNPVFPSDLPFDPAGWRDGKGCAPLGDPRAAGRARDTEFRVPWLGFPATLRTEGPGSNTIQTRAIHGLLYETLLQLDPESGDLRPCLASHWREDVHEDGTRTYTFRIDRRARWADGREVTSLDVLWTYLHRIRPEDPALRRTFDSLYERPRIVDRRTVSVTTREANWRALLYFGGMPIYPAEAVSLPGDVYLERDERLLPMGSGPYELRPEDVEIPRRLMLRRRADAWADATSWGRHLYNFDRVVFEVWPSNEAIGEAFWGGDLGAMSVSTAYEWCVAIPQREQVKQGWVQACKVYTEAPQGYSGLCFNMREPPLDDRRVRLALCHLFPREQLIETLFRGEYELQNSYYPGRDWGNGAANPPIAYDPARARALLAEAGFTETNDDGTLVDSDGNELAFTIRHYPTWGRIFDVVKRGFAAGGVRLRLQPSDPAEKMRRAASREFQIHYQAWGALPFPNPETSWHSSLADQTGNSNLPGFADPRVDALCRAYDSAPDLASRKAIVREIDAIVYAEHPYALGWYAPYTRVAWWNVYGHPATMLMRTTDVLMEAVLTTWWVDPEKRAALEKAMREGEALEQGPREIRPWAGKEGETGEAYAD